jgi:hypothetical protein
MKYCNMVYMPCEEIDEIGAKYLGCLHDCDICKECFEMHAADEASQYDAVKEE